MNKDRNISTFDFLQALQKEYICLEIRSKIYISRNDKEYFKKLMDKKKSSILAISKKNSLPNIIESEDEYLQVWKQVVPKYGFPNLIYNIVNVSDKQLKFAYRGTVLKLKEDEIYGVVDKVNFDDNSVDVVMSNNVTRNFLLEDVQRLDHKQTDKYFYYYPNNQFNTKFGQIGTLQSYDMKNEQVFILFNDKSCVPLHSSEISRIL